jgi:hypothetical protein
MLKIFAVVLLATSMSAGSVYARVYGGIPMGRGHFPTAPRALSKQWVYAARRMDPVCHQLCQSDRYCHTFDGVCREQARVSVSQRHSTLRSHAAPIHP